VSFLQVLSNTVKFIIVFPTIIIAVFIIFIPLLVIVLVITVSFDDAGLALALRKDRLCAAWLV
jgi:energy-coupling factor transporter transmembrane protein EcfT